jgi:hypothetical protein
MHTNISIYNGETKLHTRVEYVDTNLEIFLYIPEHVDKNSCGFFDSIHGGVSTTAVTTTIIKNVCTYTVLTIGFTTCCRTYMSNLQCLFLA